MLQVTGAQTMPGGGGRKVLFTPEVLEQIPKWIKEGMRPPEIAQRIGCALGSLKAICSVKRISLAMPPAVPRWRPPHWRKVLEAEVGERCYSSLRERARRMDTTVEGLITTLLEQIANDNLYDAVLDGAGELSN